MPLQEQKVFIEDPKPNLTKEEKNMHLSYKLCAAPHHDRSIFRIERVEIGASGWWIYYRDGSPE